jgi:hypothetical protein
MLVLESLAGQRVAVLPLTHLLRDTSVTDTVLAAPRAALQTWADSITAETLLDGAPEVSWVMGEELTRAARKGAGMIPEPDRMGQSVMRAEQLKQVPDPLRSNLRTLMALVGGRYAFIPASVRFDRDPEGAVRASLSAVLVDTRTGQVAWRSQNAIGAGPSPAEALRAAVGSFLPGQP